MIILKITEKHGFTISLEDKILEKSQGVTFTSPSGFRVNLTRFSIKNKLFEITKEFK